MTSSTCEVGSNPKELLLLGVFFMVTKKLSPSTCGNMKVLANVGGNSAKSCILGMLSTHPNIQVVME